MIKIIIVIKIIIKMRINTHFLSAIFVTLLYDIAFDKRPG